MFSARFHKANFEKLLYPTNPQVAKLVNKFAGIMFNVRKHFTTSPSNTVAKKVSSFGWNFN